MVSFQITWVHLSLNACLYIYIYLIRSTAGCHRCQKNSPRNDAQFKQCTPGLKALQSLWTSDGEGFPQWTLDGSWSVGFLWVLLGGFRNPARKPPFGWLYKTLVNNGDSTYQHVPNING